MCLLCFLLFQAMWLRTSCLKICSSLLTPISSLSSPSAHIYQATFSTVLLLSLLTSWVICSHSPLLHLNSLALHSKPHPASVFLRNFILLCPFDRLSNPKCRATTLEPFCLLQYRSLSFDSHIKSFSETWILFYCLVNALAYVPIILINSCFTYLLYQSESS